MAEPEPQVEADWAAVAKACLAKGDAFLSEDATAAGCPIWVAGEDAEGASIWRGERCVHYLGADGKGRTMPFKTEGIVEGVAPEVLLADLTRIETKWNDKERKPVVRLVEEVNATTKVWYEERKFPWPIWNRESCYIETWELREGGTIALSREAIIHPDAAFDDTQRVRLRDFSSQLMIPDGYGGTKYVLSMEFNVGGNLPGGMVDRFLKDMARVPERLTGKFKEDPAHVETLKVEAAAKLELAAAAPSD
jgi:hypothetical protein